MGAVQLLLVVGLVFGINLLPAFGPPTWAVLVYVRFAYGLPIPFLVIFGALAAGAGRVVLAHVFRHVGQKLPAKRREGLTVLGRSLASSRRGLLASLLFFLIAPVSSSALFEAAGLARLPLAPLTGAFVVGRMGSYSISLLAAAAAGESLQGVLEGGWTSPLALTFGAVSVVIVVALVFIDWMRVIDWVRGRVARARGHSPPPPMGSLSTPTATATEDEARG